MRSLSKFLIFLVLFWTLSILLISFLSFYSLPKNPLQKRLKLVETFSNWDGSYFLEIARNGYNNKDLYAFFPLYPALTSFFSKSTGVDLLPSSLLISIFGLIGSVYFLKNLLKFDYPEVLVKKIIILFLFFPTSFFLIGSYSESLFIFLSILTFYFVRKFNQSKKTNRSTLFYITLATISALLASLTRLVGLLLILALWIEVFLENKKLDLKIKLICLLAPLGFFLYSLYLFNQTGNPFYFLLSEQQNWQRTLTFPGVSLWQSWESLFGNKFSSVIISILIDLMFTIFALGLAIRSFRYLRKSYVFYCLASVLLPLLTSSLMSVPRFILAIFPIFIVLGLIKNETFNLFYLIISILLLSFNIILFTSGYWVS